MITPVLRIIPPQAGTSRMHDNEGLRWCLVSTSTLPWRPTFNYVTQHPRNVQQQKAINRRPLLRCVKASFGLKMLLMVVAEEGG